MGVRWHCEGGEGVVTCGSESNALWMYVWILFVEYAVEVCRGMLCVENLKEVLLCEGWCGGSWECMRYV